MAGTVELVLVDDLLIRDAPSEPRDLVSSGSNFQRCDVGVPDAARAAVDFGEKGFYIRDCLQNDLEISKRMACVNARSDLDFTPCQSLGLRSTQLTLRNELKSAKQSSPSSSVIERAISSRISSGNLGGRHRDGSGGQESGCRHCVRGGRNEK
jgi:hypothetical protein